MATWQVKIAAIDVTSDVPYQSVDLQNTGYPGTGALSFALEPGSTSACTQEDLVEFYTDAVLQYRGYVRDLQKNLDPGYPLSRSVVCQDLLTDLAGDIVESGGLRSGDSDKARITALFTAWGTRGIIVGAFVQTLMATVPEFDYTGMSLYDAVAQIARLTGGSFYVAADRQLHYFLTESAPAPFALSDVPSPPTSYGYGLLSVPSASQGLFNRVIVYGSPDVAPRVRSNAASIAAYGVTRTGAIRDERLLLSATMDAYGDAFLAEHAFPKEAAKVTVFRPGLVSGHQVQITNAALGWSALGLRVQTVQMKVVSPTEARFEVGLGDAPVDLGSIISGTAADAAAAAVAASTAIAQDFATGLVGQVKVVSSLPNLPDTEYLQGQLVMLTTNSKLYRQTGNPGSHPSASTWSVEIASVDMTGQLTDAQIAAIAAAKVTGTIVETQIADDAITTPKIAAGAVTAAEVAAGAIVAGKIAAGTIVAADIAAATITGTKIAAGAISASELATDSVIAGKVAAGAIGAAAIAAGAITSSKIAVSADRMNLIPNGSFEEFTGTPGVYAVPTLLTDWTATSADLLSTAIESVNTKSGIYVAVLKSLGGVTANGGLYRGIPVRAGSTYRLSGWAWKASSGGAAAQVLAHAFDKAWTVVAYNVMIAVNQNTSVPSFGEARYTVPAGVANLVVYARFGGTPTTAEIAAFENVTLEEVPAGLSNIDGTVEVDNTGIRIKNGAMTVEDEFGRTVLRASGFDGDWLDFLTYGVYNARFASGAVGAIADGRTSALPYWTVSRTGSPVLTRVADATYPGGYRVDATFAALTDEITLVSDPLGQSGLWSHLSVAIATTRVAGDLSVTVWIDSYTVGGTLIESLGPQGWMSSFSSPLKRVGFGKVGSSAATGYMRVRIILSEFSAHSASNKISLGYVDMTPVISAGAIDGTDQAILGQLLVDEVIGPDDIWVAPTLLNSWVNYSASFTPAGYRKDANLNVHLRGMIKTGTVGLGAFQLPVAFRPAYQLLMGTISNGAIGRVDVFPSGEVRPVAPSSNVWVSLDGIVFKAEA